ncbi:MAG TPA: Crp/Fnr family transcriptional regulator [Cytophagales bacterium]|nr:Crp/Fnr family transcriptional regulator [Cytophagales bacterium]HAA19778.1 Crp/Fnr family transcriptional regulator [Cytophagales bacterium]HAP64861.1 Crp/Fnr family transcriptional regulator [Cytophagales bacterium]
MSDTAFLLEIFKPENFTAEELALVLAQYHRREFKKNEFLIPFGSTANYYFFLESGFARSYAVDPEGNDVTTKFFGPRDIVIDWHSYFLKQPCRESIQALSPVVGWRIQFEDFMKLFSIEAFREVGRTRLVNNYFALKNHAVSMISDPAKDRYLHLLETQPEVIQNVPLKHVATYLGITDTSLSRIRKEILNER